MSNVATEHGPRDLGPNRTGPGLSPGGSRPPKPSTDHFGSVSPDGPESFVPMSVDPDNNGDID